MCNKYEETSINLGGLWEKVDFYKWKWAKYDFCNSTIPWKHKIRTIWGPPVSKNQSKLNLFEPVSYVLIIFDPICSAHLTY